MLTTCSLSLAKEVIFVTALDLWGGLGEGSALASMRTDGREKEIVCGCLNFILSLSSTQFITIPEVALQWRICPNFQVQKKIRNRAPLHANKRICSFPSAHLFYAAICSIIILIVIKHHHFFSPWEIEQIKSGSWFICILRPLPLSFLPFPYSLQLSSDISTRVRQLWSCPWTGQAMNSLYLSSSANVHLFTPTIANFDIKLKK